jgi:hypothetical protein
MMYYVFISRGHHGAPEEMSIFDMLIQVLKGLLSSKKKKINTIAKLGMDFV